MSKEKVDFIAEKAGIFKKRMANVFEEAHAKQQAGEFKLVDEFIAEPYDGYAFYVNRGQSFRFELIDGNQIIDVALFNRNNYDEYFSDYSTLALAGPVAHENWTMMSNSPYLRGMATVIRDTVSKERLEKRVGKGATHAFAYGTFHCNEGTMELSAGTKNLANCRTNLLNALNRIGGEDLMRQHPDSPCCMFFQPMLFDYNNGAPLLKVYESHGIFRSGDYVELIAEQDLTVVFSMCPWGDQTNLTDTTKNISWPISVKTFETGIDVPDVGPIESTDPIEFIKQGRPNVAEYGRGVPGGETSFEAQAKLHKE